MTSRNLGGRLQKLESAGRRDDHFLMVWRLPDTDVSAAMADVRCSRHDRVACFEWFGDDQPPAPRWHRNIRADLTDIEHDYIHRTVVRMIETGRLPSGIIVGGSSHTNADKMSDGELYHSMSGVAL